MSIFVCVCVCVCFDVCLFFLSSCTSLPLNLQYSTTHSLTIFSGFSHCLATSLYILQHVLSNTSGGLESIARARGMVNFKMGAVNGRCALYRTTLSKTCCNIQLYQKVVSIIHIILACTMHSFTAEQLIQSLLQVDNDPEKYLDLPSSKFDKQRHTLHWLAYVLYVNWYIMNVS